MLVRSLARGSGTDSSSAELVRFWGRSSPLGDASGRWRGALNGSFQGGGATLRGRQIDRYRQLGLQPAQRRQAHDAALVDWAALPLQRVRHNAGDGLISRRRRAGGGLGSEE